MFHARGIEAVASITELRSKTSALLRHVMGSETALLIQKNNEPRAVLLSYERYVALAQGAKRKKG